MLFYIFVEVISSVNVHLFSLVGNSTIAFAASFLTTSVSILMVDMIDCIIECFLFIILGLLLLLTSIVVNPSPSYVFLYFYCT